MSPLLAQPRRPSLKLLPKDSLLQLGVQPGGLQVGEDGVRLTAPDAAGALPAEQAACGGTKVQGRLKAAEPGQQILPGGPGRCMPTRPPAFL